eukprot:9554813-Lingulodinium_polyedra.AAC.1
MRTHLIASSAGLAGPSAAGQSTLGRDGATSAPATLGQREDGTCHYSREKSHGGQEDGTRPHSQAELPGQAGSSYKSQGGHQDGTRPHPKSHAGHQDGTRPHSKPGLPGQAGT